MSGYVVKDLKLGPDSRKEKTSFSLRIKCFGSFSVNLQSIGNKKRYGKFQTIPVFFY